MNDDDTKKVTDQFGLTEEQWAQLNALKGPPNTDDIPEAPEENWANARRGLFYRPRKEAISLRLDMDVLDWLRRKGPGYQTTINRVLRERMNAETAAEKP
jgi:uncharacterized protein (DUF4415 family)